MKLERHTPTPWKVQDNRIIQRFYNESWNKQIPASWEDVEIAKFNSCEQAELAAKAVNAHEELLEMLLILKNCFSDSEGERENFQATISRETLRRVERILANMEDK